MVTQNSILLPDYAPKLVDELRSQQSKLMIGWDEYDLIQAIDSDFGNQFDHSIVLSHDKGWIECGLEFPKRRDFYFSGHKYEQLSFFEKKRILFREIVSGEYQDDEEYDIEFPWVGEDGISTEEQMEEWLAGKTCWEDDELNYAKISGRLPGYEIFLNLPEEDRKALGMFEKEVGTIGFSVTGITMVDGQVDDLLELMVKYELPFYWEE
jgi:hypothetical protein